MTVLFDRLAYMDRLKRAGLDEEQARAITEALEQASHSIVTRTDRDIMPTLARIESKLDGTRSHARDSAEMIDLQKKLTAIDRQLAEHQRRCKETQRHQSIEYTPVWMPIVTIVGVLVAGGALFAADMVLGK